MKAPVRCILCDHGKRNTTKACPLCIGTGFQLVDEQQARNRLIKDIYKKKVKVPE